MIVGSDTDGTSELRDRLECLFPHVSVGIKSGTAVFLSIESLAPALALIDVDPDEKEAALEVAGQIRARWGMPVLFVCDAGVEKHIPAHFLYIPFGYLTRPFEDRQIRMITEMALHANRLEKEHARAEQAREMAEKNYHLLADNLQDVIFTLDMDLNYTYISPSIRTMRGFDVKEVIGRSLLTMVTPESRAKILETFDTEMALESSGPSNPDRFQMVEAEMICKNGSTIWTEAKFSFIRDKKGDAIGIIGINRDISERKQIITQLRESEEKFRALAEACPFAIMIYQADYWVYTNPAGERISGFSREELYRQRFWEIVHPDYQPLVRERGNRRQAGKTATPAYDFKIIGKSGESIWVSLSGGSFMYEGKPAGMITVIDITERKKFENVLRESEEKYRTILENIEDGYYEVDLDGNFVFFNDFICRISGYAREEMLGVNYRQYTDEINALKIYQAFNAVYQTGRPAKTFDLEVIRKDKSLRYVEISISPIFHGNDAPSGFRGIIRDITERKQAEEQKRNLEAQLQQAQKMEAVGTLAGGIAHDFNNILQVINGYAQLLLLKKNQDDPDYMKLFQLQKSGERAARLIEQLLAFSRKMEGRHRPISLNREILQAQKFLKHTLPKMIDLQFDLEPSLWPVKGDPVHMEQILLNLGSNAADAMPEGGKLRVETRNVILDQAYCDDHLGAAPGSYVLLAVSDTGCGMDPKTVEHIFDPFFTTKEIGRGTGLGMASVYGIVKSHGGYIMCYSELGHGTIFKIYLPALTEGAVIDEAVPAETAQLGGTETILLVDDEAAVRDTALQMLEYYGYQVISAGNGEEALDIYQRYIAEIDLVILDLSMPGMGGLKCMEKILDINPSAKILIASGYSTSGHAEEALASGASEFIGKPYQIRELATKVRSIFDLDLHQHN